MAVRFDIVIALRIRRVKSGGGPPHSKTLRARDDVATTRSVLDCSSPLELYALKQNASLSTQIVV
jgi:hypothetical protein